MDLFLQYLANGIVIGSSYVLVAVGLTLIFGILGVVNFAHGEFYMLGGYIGVTAVTIWGLPLLAALPLVIACAVVIGFLAERLLHKALKDSDPTNSIIASFGLAVAIQNAMLLTMGPQAQMMNIDLSALTMSLGPVFLPGNRVLIPIVTLVLILGLYAVLHFTWTGRSLRAMAQHGTIARLCGVRVDRVAIVTFIAAAALAGVAGTLMSSVYSVHPMAGNMIVLKAFTVVILGGMGNVGGAAAAGLILGITESMTAGYIANGVRDIVGFVIVILVLLFLPNGLFGKAYDRS